MKISFTLREATEADVPIILQLIRELAEYERLLHDVTATEESVRQTLFGPRPFAQVLIADVAEGVAGFALFFHNYASFLAKPGIYLEDVFVRPQYRGKGIGKAFFHRIARLAVERGCGRFEWSVLNWNEPSIQFYKSLGAVPLEEWTTQRITGDALIKLAAEK